MDQKQLDSWQSSPHLRVFVNCLGSAVVIGTVLFCFLGVVFPNATMWITIAGDFFLLLWFIGWIAVVVLTIAKLRWFAKKGD